MMRGISPSSIPQARSGLRKVIMGVMSRSSYPILLRGAPCFLPAMQERREGRPQRLVGEKAYVVVAAGAAFAPDFVEEGADRLLVRLPERPGLGEHLFVPLDVPEQGRGVEGELQLVARRRRH